MHRLEERVGTLIESGRGDLATDLLRAAYHSRGIDDVEFVTDDRVRVVAEPFHGEHDVEIDGDGSVRVQPESQYQFVGDDIETEFEVRSLTDTELRTIRSAVRANESVERERDGSTAAAATEDPTVIADGGRDETSISGVRERLLKVLPEWCRSTGERPGQPDDSVPE